MCGERGEGSSPQDDCPGALTCGPQAGSHCITLALGHWVLEHKEHFCSFWKEVASNLEVGLHSDPP